MCLWSWLSFRVCLEFCLKLPVLFFGRHHSHMNLIIFPTICFTMKFILNLRSDLKLFTSDWSFQLNNISTCNWCVDSKCWISCTVQYIQEIHFILLRLHCILLLSPIYPLTFTISLITWTHNLLKLLNVYLFFCSLSGILMYFIKHDQILTIL